MGTDGSNRRESSERSETPLYTESVKQILALQEENIRKAVKAGAC
jgi:hypothetical protein